ncbi:MAG: hypothetical protein RL021_2047 [Bacteroidota bacterium]|jgi:hypothetical protein
MSDHFRRMIRLAEEFFAAKNDPDQLDVDEDVIARLQALHPSTLSEEVVGDGPVVWILLMPATEATMQRFLRKEINERQLLENARTGDRFDAIYLCSALVLPEFRKQGRAERTALNAIREIIADHPVTALFVWPFSNEGERLALRLADALQLPLHKRPD